MLLGEKLHREERSLVQLTDELLCLCLPHVSVSGGHTPQTSSAEYVIVG